MCFVIHISSLLKCLFKSVAHFFTEDLFDFFFSVEFESSFYIADTSSLSDM